MTGPRGDLATECDDDLVLERWDEVEGLYDNVETGDSESCPVV